MINEIYIKEKECDGMTIFDYFYSQGLLMWKSMTIMVRH